MFNKKLCKVCSILFIFIMFFGMFSVYAETFEVGSSVLDRVRDIVGEISGSSVGSGVSSPASSRGGSSSASRSSSSTISSGPKQPTAGNAIGAATDVVADIWSTAEVIVQILAVAAVVFAGLRYMFASADGRADIKRQTIILVAGAILVFGAVEVAQFIYNATNEIL